MSKSVLLLGHKGMLGRAFCELFEREGIAYRGLDLPELDITDAEQVRGLIAPGVEAVINCAAYTNVDGAEDDEQTALRINGDGAANLAKACAEAAVPLVHYSTDYVFDGQASEPYAVDAPFDPINAYGRTKAAGERAIREAGGPHLILRTSWLYAPWGNNFVLTMVKLTGSKETLSVVNDQRGRPTSAEHLAALTWQLLEGGARGTLHGTDGGECTWFEFTQAINELCGHPCDVQPCSSDAFPRPAKRPAYSVLDIAPTEAIVGSLPHWRQNLAAVLKKRS